MAKAFPPSEPTMVLDFTALDSSAIKATVIHQFGHALGLGHALMNPKDWAIVKKHVDMEKMMEDLGVCSEKDLEVQWIGKGLSEVNRDPISVMQYWYVIHSLALGPELAVDVLAALDRLQLGFKRRQCFLMNLITD